jgi:peptidyl-prolyl cis-trans isomerase SurA
MKTKYLLTGVLLLAAAVVSPVLGVEILEQVLVKVNGEIITKTDLEQRQITALRQAGDLPELVGLLDEVRNDWTAYKKYAQVAKWLESVTPEIIVSAVDELLILQRARELGYGVTPEQIANIIESIKKDNNILTEEQFQAALKGEGMTLVQLERMLERQALMQRVQAAEVNSKISLTEEEQRQYYDAHLNEFETVPGVTLREILVAVPTEKGQVNVAADEAARQKAEDLRKRILAGESFEKLAAEVSDAPSKANGGLIGPIPRAELAPEMLKRFSGMKTGDVTEVIRVGQGYEIFKLEQSIESTTLPFEAARSQAADKVFAQKHAVEMERFLTKLRSVALIEWKNEEIRKAYEQGLAARAARLG